MPRLVLIASKEHLDLLQGREDLADALTFADTDALRALDAITRQKPQVVALEKSFSQTSRGAALINRIKADPSLVACEIRVVSTEGDDSIRVGARASAEPAPGPAISVAEPVVVPVAASVSPLDQRGTRRAPRFRLLEGVEVMVDGNPATLVDLSVVGAQVVSPTILKPNQRVRLSLMDAPRPLRISAAVAWAAFELPPRYRAGLVFADADPAALTAFIEARKRT